MMTIDLFILQMGALLSLIFGSSQEDALDLVDESVGLSARQKLSIQKTWTPVMQERKKHAVGLFVL